MRYCGIDPSTETGFVALGKDGEVLRAKDLTGIGVKDPKRITTLVGEVVAHMKPNDVVGIEGFSYNSQGRGIGFQFGVGYAIRIALYSRNYKYREVTPGQLKKFASGSGNASKKELIKPVKEQWGFTHSSDNVIDAYVLARIIYSIENYDREMFSLTDYQRDVINSILYPVPKKKKVKKKIKA